MHFYYLPNKKISVALFMGGREGILSPWMLDLIIEYKFVCLSKLEVGLSLPSC